MSKRKAADIDSDEEFSSGTITEDDDELNDDKTSNDESSSRSSEDENNEPDLPIDVPWTENGIPRPYFPFTTNAGPQVDIEANNILSIFELFFDEHLIQLITEETNR